jgi:trehalose 2-sulfotransferase
MNSIKQIFSNPAIDQGLLAELDALQEPRSRFVIAFTPRSGSSYLCDVMKRIRRFGKPDEVLNQQFIPNILKKIPGRTPEEYLRNVIRHRKTPNGVSGLKTSWFQFDNFIKELENRSYLCGFRYIYLTRRNRELQAVSLYKATSTTVFHTNVHHDEEAIHMLRSIEYNYAKISEWYKHIDQQEKGWQSYFFENRVFPLCINYEEIEEDILSVLKRIAAFVKVNPNHVKMPDVPSVFKKISDQRNIEWAHRFVLENS